MTSLHQKDADLMRTLTPFVRQHAHGSAQCRSRSFVKPPPRSLERQWGQQYRSECARLALHWSISHSAGEEEYLWLGVQAKLPLGIDIESKRRAVHDRLRARISHPAEGKIELDALRFWMIKEAAYKADPANQGRYLAQYRVVQWHYDQERGFIHTPEQRPLAVALTTSGSWRIALAVCKDAER